MSILQAVTQTKVKKYEEKTFTNLSKDEIDMKTQAESVPRFAPIGDASDHAYAREQLEAHKSHEYNVKKQDDEMVRHFRENAAARSTVGIGIIAPAKDASKKRVMPAVTHIKVKSKKVERVDGDGSIETASKVRPASNECPDEKSSIKETIDAKAQDKSKKKKADANPLSLLSAYSDSEEEES